MLNELKTANLHKPPLVVTTRWNSTYDMLNALLNLKDFIYIYNLEKKDNVNLNYHEWSIIETIVQTLEPAERATEIFKYFC